MNPIMQQLVNHKVNSLSSTELLQLSEQYQIPLNEQQANKVIQILRTEKINVANTEQIHRILNRLQTEVDPYVSNVVQQLMQQFNQYL
ncbi:hypothetical protein AJ85_15695 [Alkalihalobacillus alcalophilus ATCC 27647 = CGMCC 1.3604]|uniref:tRNA methyltransferase n=1 Tax=Alkalihalobacillus alcalophilus ATCC 27647 = CGMCC 1.3604 TaxID=1218173 RepID=A0A094WDU1_ALKAL|nr:DUF2624 family protein [Alkalihalobacillus alcalophilus]KGA95919.1 hypothetical protein BALCAV_0219430 [Alkalihalobacillus alcalophilus ATCC 27647 = CGMCC 1.3604]MED1563714.1 DUF2624 family protein [Alkalihalobacillus alcalophilus]THG89692.1 hypothetical protein AJ85_15695 [Alkalihalobacillus alcalophilus ATCC 27647 = CGMCC 1.3604]